MLLGRPTTLWGALITAVIAFLQVAIVTLVPDVDVVAVATILGSLGGLLAVIVAFLANQPPTVAQGGQINVATPAGEPNVLATVNTPNSLTPVP